MPLLALPSVGQELDRHYKILDKSEAMIWGPNA